MKILNEAQTYELLSVINLRAPFGERDQAMILLALQTGLRVSELAGLNHQHVISPNGVPFEFLDLPADLTKYHSSRVIGLSPGARKAIARLAAFNRSHGFSVAPNAPLLQNRFHQRLTVRAIQRLMVEYREKAELGIRATPHTLRHTMATNFLLHCGDIEALQKNLGHRRLATTQVYAHRSQRERNVAFRTFPEPNYRK